ncbi:MAG: hypothetical protein FE78DRAFT_86245 [Acidomyces sp. 'richmondensis']|nr:MAG: hypothetical protein FE78DRAFT_86245 [Acidomyces sp. 'richmondensis']
MSQDQRREPATPQHSIPSAPPLPAPKPLQRARDVAYRVFGFPPSRPSSAHDEQLGDRLTYAPGGRHASLGAYQNATASHRTGLEINTIAINEKGTHALLGGKEIFKTIKVEGGACIEDLNLRTEIRSRPTEASGKPRNKYAVDIADVAWAKGDSVDLVAAATSSGKIILYDLGHAGLQAAQLHEHARQVHKVTFNPHKGSLLLSGSQDGTVRLWDVRDVRHQASTLQSKRKYSGQNDGVRDVKWSPTDGVDFAFGTDSGWIQVWDMRHLKTAKIKIPAHVLSCNIIDWHPDGKHVVSGSSDKTVRVWDLTSAGKQKTGWEIKTPYPVLNARWRPPCESSLPQHYGIRQCTHLVTAYDREHPVIHLWDFRRPNLPFREMSPYSSAPTDLLWHSQDLLWTVGREGIFLQSDVQHASKVINNRALQSFATSIEGSVTFIVQRRKNRRVPQVSRPPTEITSTGSSVSVSPESNFLSRSWADDSLDHSFLSASPSSQIARRNEKFKMPLTAPVTGTAIIPFNMSMNDKYSYAPRQVGVVGRMPFQIDPDIFRYLAQKCCATVQLSQTMDETLLQLVQDAFDNNVHHTYRAGQYLLAQSWKILGHAFLRHLKARAQYQKERQERKRLSLTNNLVEPRMGNLAVKLLSEKNKSAMQSAVSVPPNINFAQQLAAPDSTSNVPTPLARPVTGAKSPAFRESGALPELGIDDCLTLPPSLQFSAFERPDPNGKLTSHNLMDLEQQHQKGSETRMYMVRRWSVQHRETPNQDSAEYHGIQMRPKLFKHDSDESFAFLAASTDSKGPSVPASYASDGLVEAIFDRSSRVPGPNGYDLTGQRANKHIDVQSNPTLEDSVVVALTDAREEVAKVSPGLVGYEPPASDAKDTKPLHYLPDAVYSHIDLEEDRPFSVMEMLDEIIRYYVANSDAQSAALMVTLLVPLLPRTHPLSLEYKKSNILSYTDTYSSMGFTDDEIETIFNQNLEHVIMAGLQPLQIEAILSTYHEQLLAYKLFNEAAHLRMLCYPAYPSVYEDFIKDNEIRLKCGGCRKVMAGGMSHYRCINCNDKQAPCSICWLNDSPYGSGKLMTTCLLCNHSGHAGCIRQWFGEMKGDGCPTGCGCECIVRDAEENKGEKQMKGEKEKKEGKEKKGDKGKKRQEEKKGEKSKTFPIERICR